MLKRIAERAIHTAIPKTLPYHISTLSFTSSSVNPKKITIQETVVEQGRGETQYTQTIQETIPAKEITTEGKDEKKEIHNKKKKYNNKNKYNNNNTEEKTEENKNTNNIQTGTKQSDVPDLQAAVELLQNRNTIAGLQSMQAIYQRDQELPISTLALVITCSKDKPDKWIIQASEKILQKKDFSGETLLHLQIVYNFLLEHNSRNLNRVLEIFQDMLLKEVEPSKLTIARVVIGYQSGFRMHKAIEMKDEMLRKGWPISKFFLCYGLIVKYLVRSGKLQAALKMKMDMEEENEKTTRDVYDALVVGFAEQGSFDKALELKREMEWKNMLLGTTAYNNLVRLYSTHHFPLVLDIKIEMEQRHVLFFPQTYESIILVALKQSPAIAKLWFEELKAKYPYYTNQFITTDIIKLYLMEGETKKAVDLYTELQPNLDPILTKQLEELKQDYAREEVVSSINVIP